MQDNRIHVDKTDCINCGRCVRACHSKGMVSQGSTLEDIQNYEYTVCIVPTAVLSRCNSKEDVQELFYAIKMLGFDEVVEHTDIDAQLVKEALLISESAKEFNFIESFCPVVNELISKKYSILGENVLQLQYPTEICAKQIRKRMEQLEEINKHGIFKELKGTVVDFDYDTKSLTMTFEATKFHKDVNSAIKMRYRL